MTDERKNVADVGQENVSNVGQKYVADVRHKYVATVRRICIECRTEMYQVSNINVPDVEHLM